MIPITERARLLILNEKNPNSLIGKDLKKNVKELTIEPSLLNLLIMQAINQNLCHEYVSISMNGWERETCLSFYSDDCSLWISKHGKRAY